MTDLAFSRKKAFSSCEEESPVLCFMKNGRKDRFMGTTVAQRFLPYGRQVIEPDDIQEVTKALQGEVITRGQRVKDFEDAIARYCGAAYAVAYNSGTTALHACYYAGKASKHDRVITTPNTFAGTLTPSLHFGVTPLLVDIDRRTGNIDLELLEMNINRLSTRGRTFVVPVHFAGVAVDMKKLNGMIRDPETLVIEDASHAIGSQYSDGQRVGGCQWSHMTVFSFHPVKTITTGEGGMVTTNDPALYDRLLYFRNNAIERDPAKMEGPAEPWSYEVLDATGNYNFTEIQAALGISQFRRLEKIVEKRRRSVGWYRDRLKNIAGITLMDPSYDAKTCYHLLVAQIDFPRFGTSRAKLMGQLKERSIGTQVHYIPLYRHPFLARGKPPLQEYFPEMEGYYSQALSLPLFVGLNEREVDYICEQLKNLLGIS